MFLGGLALLACILASHNMGADKTPVRAGYPTGTLVDKLQGHDDGVIILFFWRKGRLICVSGS